MKNYEELYFSSLGAGQKWMKDPSNKEAFIEAMRGYEEIIAAPEDFPFKGGAYVNWANLETNRRIITTANPKYDFLIKENKQIENYYEKALEIKPDNEKAIQGLGIYYFAIQQFEASYSYYNQLTDPKAKGELLNYYLRGDMNYGYYLKGKNLQALDNPSRIRFYERIYKDHKELGIKVQTAYLLVHYYEVTQEHKKSYDIMNELIEGPAGSEFKIILYEKLARLCSKAYLNKPEESVKYAQEGLELIASQVAPEDPRAAAGLKQVETLLKSHLLAN